MLGVDLVRRCSFIALTDELKIDRENKFNEDIVNLPNKPVENSSTNSN